MPALVTPMHPDGSLDYQSFRALVDWHVQEGTNALVIVGTSGESPTVNVDEHAELIRVAHARDVSYTILEKSSLLSSRPRSVS